MVDPVTPLIGFAVPTRGSDVGTWDVPVNGNSTILDNIFGLVTTKTLSSSTVTLTSTECQANIIRVSGTLTANVNVVLPMQKSYCIENLTVGNFFVCFRSNISQLGVGVPQGSRQIVWSDGTNMKWASEDASPGDLKMFWGTAAPTWMSAFTASGAPAPWLVCDSSSFSSVTYPYLFAVLGSTTLPDLRGRTLFSLDGGTGRITAAGSGINGSTLGANGGSQLTQQHNHGVVDTGHVHRDGEAYNAVNFAGSAIIAQVVDGQGGSDRFTDSATTGIIIQNFGAGGSQNMPPATIGGVWMIKT